MPLKKEIKLKLVRHLTFLEYELQDWGQFRSYTWEQYHTNRDQRRNIERWIENIINSSIDISKIILATENIPLPETYKEIIISLSLLPGFEKAYTEKLSEWVKLRNIISHEYLDVKWRAMNQFVQDAEPFYQTFLERVKLYFKDRL